MHRTVSLFGQEPIRPNNARHAELKRLLGRGCVSHLAWSPDGQNLAVGGPLGAWLYPTGTTSAAARRLVDPAGSEVFVLAWHPTEQILATALSGGFIHLWDNNDGIIQRTFVMPNTCLTCLAWSPDGRWLAAGGHPMTSDSWDGPGIVGLWDRSTDQEIILTSDNSIAALCFNPHDQTLVYVTVTRAAYVWNLNTQEEVVHLEGQANSGPVQVACSDQGIFLLARDPVRALLRLHLWQPVTGDMQVVFSMPSTSIVTLEHGLQIVAYIDNQPAVDLEVPQAIFDDNDSLHIWGWQQRSELAELPRPPGPVTQIIFRPDGQLFATVDAEAIRVWEGTSGQLIQVFGDHAENIRVMANTPDGSLLAAAGSQHNPLIWLHSLAPDVTSTILRGHLAGVTQLQFDQDGTILASAGVASTIRLWHTSTTNLLAVLRGHHGAIQSLAVSPDGQEVLSSSWDHTIRLWDVATGSERQHLSDWWFNTSDVIITPEARRLVVISQVASVTIHDEHGHTLAVWAQPPVSVWRVVFSPDARWVAIAGAEGTLQLWEWETGTCQVLQFGTGQAATFWRAVKFSPDSHLIVGSRARGMTGTTQVWTVVDGQERLTVSGGGVMTFSPDRSVLAVTGDPDEATIALWDVQAGICLAKLEGHTREVNALLFTPDQRLLVSGSADGTIRLWGVH